MREGCHHTTPHTLAAPNIHKTDKLGADTPPHTRAAPPTPTKPTVGFGSRLLSQAPFVPETLAQASDHGTTLTEDKRPVWALGVVGGGGGGAPPPRPVGVLPLPRRLVSALVGVRSKVVALGLEEVGRQPCAAIAIVEGQSRAEAGGRDAVHRTRRSHVAPPVLVLVNLLHKEIVDEQARQLRVGGEGLLDLAEEGGSDDAPPPPHECDVAVVELPAHLIRRRPHQHKALSVADHLGTEHGATQVLQKRSFVAGELGVSRTLDDSARVDPLRLESREAPSKHALPNERHGHAHVERCDGRPLAGALLACLIEDEIEKVAPILLLVCADVSRDLDEEAVEVTLVPLGEDASNLGVVELQHVAHHLVALADDLHVAVLDTVVHHLDVVAGAGVPHPLAAR
mmetsp:Transcript_17377/g.34074  ORF Transcript_17377/g.34074 Transcript_17377/m.34074 type:complete len:398 (+) Transcript_17377:108-1301(+)